MFRNLQSVLKTEYLQNDVTTELSHFKSMKSANNWNVSYNKITTFVYESFGVHSLNTNCCFERLKANSCFHLSSDWCVCVFRLAHSCHLYSGCLRGAHSHCVCLQVYLLTPPPAPSTPTLCIHFTLSPIAIIVIISVHTPPRQKSETI